jgi:hypothetical protein
MNNTPLPSAEIVSSLILFNLFERLCAGFMSWGAEKGEFDNEFYKHLHARIEKMELKKDSDLTGEPTNPFDTGLMPRDLAEYLRDKANKGLDETAFGKAKIKPKPFYEKIQELTRMRNKVMHGLPAPESAKALAHRIAWIMDQIARIMGEHIGAFSKPRTNSKMVDHTTWARLLFLTEEELLWVASGNQMPAGGSFKKVISLPIGNRGTGLIDFRKTDRPHGSKTIPLGTAADLSNFESVWVSTAHFKVDELAKAQGVTRQFARELLGVPQSFSRKLYLGELSEGLDDVESDPFSIPWWQKAPEGSAYIYIAL